MNTSVSRTVSVSIPAPGGQRPTWQRPASRGGPPTCQSRSAQTSARLGPGAGRRRYSASVAPPPTPRVLGRGAPVWQTPHPRLRPGALSSCPPPLPAGAYSAVRVVCTHSFIVMLPAFRAHMHGVTHRESDALPPADARADDADARAEEPAKTGAAAGCQDPATYADDLHCNAASMLSEDAVDGLR